MILRSGGREVSPMGTTSRITTLATTRVGPPPREVAVGSVDLASTFLGPRPIPEVESHQTFPRGRPCEGRAHLGVPQVRQYDARASSGRAIHSIRRDSRRYLS